MQDLLQNRRLKHFPPSTCERMQFAIATGDTHLVTEFLEKGYPPDHFNKDLYETSSFRHTDSKRTPLQTAIRFRRVEIVKLLLKHGAKIHPCSNITLSRPYIIEASSSFLPNSEIIKVLISHGADINEQDREGTTALMSTVRAGNTDAIPHLISCGASINTQNAYSDTALDCAVRWKSEMQENCVGNDRVLKSYLSRMSCCQGITIDNILILIRHGSDVNKCSEFSGETALHVLLRTDNSHLFKTGAKTVTNQILLTTFKEFLLCGAHVDIPDHTGKTVFDLICNSKELSCCESTDNLLREKFKKDLLRLCQPRKLQCLAACELAHHDKILESGVLPALINKEIKLHKSKSPAFLNTKT